MPNLPMHMYLADQAAQKLDSGQIYDHAGSFFLGSTAPDIRAIQDDRGPASGSWVAAARAIGVDVIDRWHYPPIWYISILRTGAPAADARSSE